MEDRRDVATRLVAFESGVHSLIVDAAERSRREVDTVILSGRLKREPCHLAGTANRHVGAEDGDIDLVGPIPEEGSGERRAHLIGEPRRHELHALEFEHGAHALDLTRVPLQPQCKLDGPCGVRPDLLERERQLTLNRLAQKRNNARAHNSVVHCEDHQVFEPDEIVRRRKTESPEDRMHRRAYVHLVLRRTGRSGVIGAAKLVDIVVVHEAVVTPDAHLGGHVTEPVVRREVASRRRSRTVVPSDVVAECLVVVDVPIHYYVRRARACPVVHVSAQRVTPRVERVNVRPRSLERRVERIVIGVVASLHDDSGRIEVRAHCPRQVALLVSGRRVEVRDRCRRRVVRDDGVGGREPQVADGVGRIHMDRDRAVRRRADHRGQIPDRLSRHVIVAVGAHARATAEAGKVRNDVGGRERRVVIEHGSSHLRSIRVLDVVVGVHERRVVNHDVRDGGHRDVDDQQTVIFGEAAEGRVVLVTNLQDLNVDVARSKGEAREVDREQRSRTERARGASQERTIDDDLVTGPGSRVEERAAEIGEQVSFVDVVGRRAHDRTVPRELDRVAEDRTFTAAEVIHGNRLRRCRSREVLRVRIAHDVARAPRCVVHQTVHAVAATAGAALRVDRRGRRTAHIDGRSPPGSDEYEQ